MDISRLSALLRKSEPGDNFFTDENVRALLQFVACVQFIFRCAGEACDLVHCLEKKTEEELEFLRQYYKRLVHVVGFLHTYCHYKLEDDEVRGDQFDRIYDLKSYIERMDRASGGSHKWFVKLNVQRMAMIELRDKVLSVFPDFRNHI